MRRRLNEQGAETESGAILQRIARFEYSYKDQATSGVIVVEGGTERKGVYYEYLSMASIDELAERDSTGPDAAKERIIANVREAMAVLGTKPVFY